VDEGDWSETLEIHGRKWDSAGTLLAEEAHELTMRSYPRDELPPMFEQAGFAVAHAARDEIVRYDLTH
jgi:hypothetical protein